MSKEEILFLIILGVVIVAALAILITVLVINSKYKNFVLENSTSIKKLIELNKRTIFKQYTPSFTLSYRYDNKRNYLQTDPAMYMSKKIRDNLTYYFDLKERMDFNRDLLAKYKEEITEIKRPIAPEVCAAAKMRHSKCLKTEMNIFYSLTQKPLTDISIKVLLRYVSPKGKVDISKSQTFNYIEIVRILDSVSTKRVDRQTYEKLARAERTILSDGMRYDVMKRDGFRCVLCGMSAKDGAILHVDHIIPVSKGGKTTMDNLRTLCEKCNIGKSNKIE